MGNETPPTLLVELTEAGVATESIWDLVNTKARYKLAIPILLDWLTTLDERLPAGDYRESLREGLIRALSTPDAKPIAAPEMVRQFRSVTDPFVRWAIGNALSVVADDNVFNDLAEIAKESQWGIARQMVVDAFGRSKDPRAVRLLLSLLDDDDVVAHATKALGKQGDPSTRWALEPLLEHPRPLVRKEAKKALAKLHP